jgi:glucose-1-phosphate cytidylyltransferase
LNSRKSPKGDNGLINGGYFVLNHRTLDLIKGDDTIWESQAIAALVKERELVAYRHPGFWHPMDTLRDRTFLEQLWASGTAPWQVWSP